MNGSVKWVSIAIGVIMTLLGWGYLDVRSDITTLKAESKVHGEHVTKDTVITQQHSDVLKELKCDVKDIKTDIGQMKTNQAIILRAIEKQNGR